MRRHVSELDAQALSNMIHDVIYALENELKDYLTNLDIDINSIILDKKRKYEKSVNPIVEIYWLELWEIAAKNTIDINLQKAFRELAELAKHEQLLNARHARSHGNRDLKLHHWYKIAAFVTDPNIEKVNFKKTITAYKRVELNVPAQTETDLDTIQNYYNYEIINNIDQIEHYEDRGFYGREKEIEQLETDLCQINSRFKCFSIIGLGGLGKTSFALQTLERIKFNDNFQGIFCYSFKSKILSSEGIIESDIKKEISTCRDNLDYFLLEKFDVILNEDIYKEKIDKLNILIFLDNLEDVLTNNKKEFELFLDTQLPSHWKILATSRVNPPAFKIIELKDLDRKSCESICNNRIREFPDHRRKDHSASFKKIIEKANGNPLILHLTYDFAKSKNISFEESLLSSFNLVIENSFENLVDFFPDDTFKILEFLRQNGETSEEKIMSFFSWKQEDVVNRSEIILNALMTKVRYLEDKKYYYNTDITNTFLFNTEKISKIRQEIFKQINEEDQSLQKAERLNKIYFKDNLNHPFRLPKTITDDAISIISELYKFNFFRRFVNKNAVSSERKILENCRDRWNSLSESFKKTYYFDAVLCKIYLILDDQRSREIAESCINKKGGSLTGKICLADYHHKYKDFKKAAAIYEELTEEFPNNMTLKNYHLVNLNFTNEPSQLEKAIKIIKKLLPITDTFNSNFINTLARLIEDYNYLERYSLEVNEALKLILKEKVEKGSIERLLEQMLYTKINHQEKFNANIDNDLFINCIQTSFDLGVVFERIQNRLNFNDIKSFVRYLNEFFNYEFKIDDIREKFGYKKNSIKNEFEDLILVKVKRKIPNKDFIIAEDVQGAEYFVRGGIFYIPNFTCDKLIKGEEIFINKGKEAQYNKLPQPTTAFLIAK